MTVAVIRVEIVAVPRKARVPIVGLTSTFCPMRQGGIVWRIVRRSIMSRQGTIVCRAIRHVRPVMEWPVLTVTVVLMGSSCTAGIAGMYVQKKPIPIRKRFSANHVMPSANSALGPQLITVPAVRLHWFWITLHVQRSVQPTWLSTSGMSVWSLLLIFSSQSILWLFFCSLPTDLIKFICHQIKRFYYCNLMFF